MYIQKLNFPAILPDNEEVYMRYLEGILSSVDYDASVMLVRTDHGMNTRISPSLPTSFNLILEEIKRFHTLLGIKVDFSKSMKAGANIYFTIDFDISKDDSNLVKNNKQ
jgi:hypothetical protein